MISVRAGSSALYFLLLKSLAQLTKVQPLNTMAPIANVDLFDPEVLTPSGSEMEEERERGTSSMDIPMIGVTSFEPLPYVKTILITGGAGFM